MKTAKNGGAKSARAQEIKSETKKLVKIAKETDSELETRRDAYRAYSAALHRAVNEGRVWRPDIIARLYPIILELAESRPSSVTSLHPYGAALVSTNSAAPFFALE